MPSRWRRRIGLEEEDSSPPCSGPCGRMVQSFLEAQARYSRRSVSVLVFGTGTSDLGSYGVDPPLWSVYSRGEIYRILDRPEWAQEKWS